MADGADKSKPVRYLDPSLEALQTEWENLYLFPSFTTTYAPISRPDNLPTEMVYELAGQWYLDALSGRKIDFPQTEFELKCFKVARSRLTLTVFSAACIIHMIVPFLQPKECPWALYESGDVQDPEASAYEDFPSHETLLVIELLMCLVYFAELGARLLVNNVINLQGGLRKIDLKDKWTFLRLCCVIAIFIDVLCNLGQLTRKFLV